MTDAAAQYEWLFGMKFNPLTRGLVRPSSVDEARHKHADGTGYGVLLRRTDTGANVVAADLGPGRPSAFVQFFDELGRTTLEYSFVPARSRPGQLWLDRVRVIEYDGEDEDWAVNESWTTKEDGKLFLNIDDKRAGTRNEKEGTREPELLERNYEPMYDFGDYASLFRRERDRGVDEQGPGSASDAARRTPVG
jgi:hypothetical protein